MENDDSYFLDNLGSATEFQEYVDEYFEAEIGAGRMAGPFAEPVHPRSRVNPSGTAPKKSYEPGVVKRRTIGHLSAGPGGDRSRSLNALTVADVSVVFASAADAVQVLQQYGAGAFLAKCDIRAAYRQLAIRPELVHLLGLSWRGGIYYDLRLPFGSSAGPAIFQAVSNAVVFAAQQRVNGSIGNDRCTVLSLLDDFLVVGRDEEACAAGFEALLWTLAEVGLEVSGEKTEGPRKQLEFLGLALCTSDGQICMGIPEDKRLDLLRQLKLIAGSRKVTKWQLLHTAGKLGFADCVIPFGRPYTSCMFARAHRGGYVPGHFVSVSRELRADAEVWCRLLESGPVSRRLDLALPTEPTIRVHGDASGTIGFGFFLTNTQTEVAWCDRWSEPWLQQQLGALKEKDSSTVRESVAMGVALETVPTVPGDVFLYHTDNEALVQAVQRGRSANRGINNVLRRMALFAAEKGLHVACCWRRRSHPAQVAADLLSRIDRQGFRGSRWARGIRTRFGTPTSLAGRVRTSLQWPNV